jgi:predicted nucleic acid-binding protein
VSLVIDASVAVKWVMAEEGFAAARDLLTVGRSLVAPDLVLAEVVSVVRREIRRGTLLAQDADLAITTVERAFVRLEPTPPLVRDAISIAVEVDHAVYDCLYLALAERTGTRW